MSLCLCLCWYEFILLHYCDYFTFVCVYMSRSLKDWTKIQVSRQWMRGVKKVVKVQGMCSENKYWGVDMPFG